MAETYDRLDPATITEICDEVDKLLRENASWETFYRKTLGLHGVVRRRFGDHKKMAEFEQTDLYSEIQQILTKLREVAKNDPRPVEPTKVITVRLPRSVHEAIRAEAFANHTSMNQLCISKLIQHIDSEFVPDAIAQLGAKGQETRDEG